MGFAKYHEDNLHIIEERMYYKNAPDTLSVVRSSYTPKQPVYSAYCPFCHCGVISKKALVDHVFSKHGNKYEFIYLNNRKVNEYQSEVTRIYSLKFYCFSDEIKHIVVTDDFDRKYYVDTVKNKYEYDLSSILNGKLFSYLSIEIPGQETPYEILQYLDMQGASIDNILQNRYVSSLFDMQISNNLLKVQDCLIYMKMLIHENEDADPFAQRIESFRFPVSRDLVELFWYYSLYKGEYDNSLIDTQDGKYTIWTILMCLLNGDLSDVESLLQKESRSDNDATGLRIIYSLLTNDTKAFSYNIVKYQYYGLIGHIVKALVSIHNYEEMIREDIENEIKELSLFASYPLINAIINYYYAERRNEVFDKKSYDMLRSVGAIVSVIYSRNLDENAVEKVLKSNIKLHPNSQLIKGIALDNDFKWIGSRISVCDDDVYRRKLNEENERQKIGFSSHFLDTFPYDDDISITPLGGEKGIGASCFVISYKGFNIMIDAGINPRKKADDSYPILDLWNGRIDLILLSHAHIDHSGGIPKAHAMWNDAPIIMTKPTKVFLKYIYSDMAKVKNGIADEFEIENVSITKEVMESTFNAISTVDFEDKVRVRDDIEICFHKAGHIVGAAMIELHIAGKTILYTGDYTDYDQNLVSGLNYEDLPKEVDYLITEATYLSNNRFDRYNQAELLKEEIRKDIAKGKSILLPGASIGRSQELICILGEMLADGEIPNDYTMYIGGMAIPTSTQLIPFFNQEYEDLLTNFCEVDNEHYPYEKSIVVASSGTMKKGSASYRIEKNWKNYGIKYSTILGGYADEDTEYEQEEFTFNERIRMSLSTHVSREGIMRLINYVQPKVVSIVHCGANRQALNNIISECKKDFANDIFFADLEEEEKCNVFNLLKQIMQEEK